MEKILTALANENLTVNPMKYKGSPEYQKALDTLYNASDKLNEKLNDEEKELFKRFCDAQEEENHLYELDVFSRGFRIAVLILFEVFAAGSDEFLISKGAGE